MNPIIRKHEILPSHLDLWNLLEIFTRVKEHPEKPQSKRVERILELLSCLRDGLSTRERARVNAGLRNALRLYKWVSFVSPTPEGFRVIHAAADGEKLSADDRWEYGAVSELLEAVPYLDDPPRIRRCIECQGWLFAKRANREYHDGCRQRHYAKDPETRAKKAEAMRNLRAAEKKRARNPKSGVGLAKRRR
jgi:hypothetical protein